MKAVGSRALFGAHIVGSIPTVIITSFYSLVFIQIVLLHYSFCNENVCDEFAPPPLLGYFLILNAYPSGTIFQS